MEAFADAEPVAFQRARIKLVDISSKRSDKKNLKRDGAFIGDDMVHLQWDRQQTGRRKLQLIFGETVRLCAAAHGGTGF